MEPAETPDNKSVLENKIREFDYRTGKQLEEHGTSALSKASREELRSLLQEAGYEKFYSRDVFPTPEYPLNTRLAYARIGDGKADIFLEDVLGKDYSDKDNNGFSYAGIKSLVQAQEFMKSYKRTMETSIPHATVGVSGGVGMIGGAFWLLIDLFATGGVYTAISATVSAASGTTFGIALGTDISAVNRCRKRCRELAGSSLRTKPREAILAAFGLQVEDMEKQRNCGGLERAGSTPQVLNEVVDE